jgi:hypothetical protein
MCGDVTASAEWLLKPAAGRSEQDGDGTPDFSGLGASGMRICCRVALPCGVGCLMLTLAAVSSLVMPGLA